MCSLAGSGVGGWDADSVLAKYPRLQVGVTINFAHKCGADATSPGDADEGGWDKATGLGRAWFSKKDSGPALGAGDRGRGGGSSMLQLSPGKTPALREEAGKRAGRPETAGTKAARGRMQSWKNPSKSWRGGGASPAAIPP